MITKPELQAVLEEMRNEDRAARIEPPTVEEMLAYRRGELSGENEERVRELLTCWPELLRALMTSYPDDDAGYLPRETIERQWRAMQKEIGGGGRVLQFRTIVTAVAAALAVVFAGLLWQNRTESRRPQAWSPQQLRSDSVRGAAPPATTLTAAGDGYRLQVMASTDQYFEKYALDLQDASGKKAWNSDEIVGHDNTFLIFIPRKFLDPGTYTLALYGINGERRERIDSFTLRVPAR